VNVLEREPRDRPGTKGAEALPLSYSPLEG